MTNERLTAERIGAVVTAHALNERGGDAATAFAMDVINMMIERHLSPSETACALELLGHLRHDRCQ